jgi:hypothetical protein
MQHTSAAPLVVTCMYTGFSSLVFNMSSLHIACGHIHVQAFAHSSSCKSDGSGLSSLVSDMSSPRTTCGHNLHHVILMAVGCEASSGTCVRHTLLMVTLFIM